MAEILKGSLVCEEMRAELKDESRKLRVSGIYPKMAIVRVGEREDDISYEKNIIKVCSAVDIKTEQVTLPVNISQEELLCVIQRINDDETVHGLMLFRPLPKHIDANVIRNAISTNKDIDGITDASAVSVFVGNGTGFAPATAEACIRLIDFYGISVEGKRAVVIGRSLVVGKPLAMLLLDRNATVTICHSKSEDLAGVCRNADFIFAAVGKSELVTRAFLNENQTIIDVGFNVSEDGRITGDVNFADAEQFVNAITPVPNGVGGVTTRVLAEHVIIAARRLSEQR